MLKIWNEYLYSIKSYVILNFQVLFYKWKNLTHPVDTFHHYFKNSLLISLLFQRFNQEKSNNKYLPFQYLIHYLLNTMYVLSQTVGCTRKPSAPSPSSISFYRIIMHRILNCWTCNLYRWLVWETPN